MTDRDITNHVAIIGMACRFPGATSIESFWDLLRKGKEGITHWSEQELLDAGVPQAYLDNPRYVKSYGHLEDYDKFDSAFFGYTPKEAQIMDPQQRIFLEIAWTALEHAGYDPLNIEVPAGVFAGAGQNIYRLRNLSKNDALLAESGEFFNTINNDNDFIATRVAYKLNLRGPSLTVQTACSTSLVAAHLAVQSLLNGECDLAIAGGSTVVTTGKEGYFYLEDGTFSPDGHTRTYDAKAQGMVGGDGAGAIVLKRLEDALVEEDTIYGVILGSAINNDGSNKVGFTAPSVAGQARVILEAQLVARVQPEEISLVEGHGTATALGDPIEVRALTEAFRRSTRARAYCALGSVKSNIGHLGAAAGVAGIIKTCLSLHHRQIPASLHFEHPNPELNLESSPFYVNDTLIEWQPISTRRIAGVSSFGIGGTNAHLIIEEGPLVHPGPALGKPQLFTWSAPDKNSLERVIQKHQVFLEMAEAASLRDISFTLNQGRSQLAYRRFAVAGNRTELIRAIARHGEGRRAADSPQVAFMFPGMGGLDINTSKDLYLSESVFRETLDHCAERIHDEIGIDILAALYPETPSEKVSEALLKPECIHPAHFSVAYATAQLLISNGVRPDAMLGQSMGEFPAAVLAGIFSLEDALSLVCLRGLLVARLPAGEMMSVSLPVRELAKILPRGIEISLENTPELCVVSGPKKDIRAFKEVLIDEKINHRILKIPFASHSTHVEPIIEDFRKAVAKIERRAPKIPIISCTTGSWLTEEQTRDPDYWAQHLRLKVKFWESAEKIASEGYLLVDLGPGISLSTMAGLLESNQVRKSVVAMTKHPRQQISERRAWLNGIGNLWSRGCQIRMDTLYAGSRPKRIPLPTYPFARTRHWIAVPVASKSTDLLARKPDPADWLYKPSWGRTTSSPLTLPSQEKNWLLFGAQHPLADRTAEILGRYNQRVIEVALGSQFGFSGRSFEMNPMDPAHYARLFSSLAAEGLLPIHAVLHMVGSRPSQDLPGCEYRNLDHILAQHFDSHMYLAKGFAQHQPVERLRYLVLTRGAHEVLGSDLIHPEQSFGGAATKVIPLELENISTLAIDLEPHSNLSDISLAERILAEFENLAEISHTKQVVAFRGNHRWEQTFERLQATQFEGSPPFKQGGHYLVTGGLSGIGLQLAEYLALNYQASLVLVSRSGLPPRERWEKLLAEPGSEAKTVSAIQAVRNMESAGARILAYKADVTNKQQLEKVIHRAEEKLGPFNGVIHSAGLPSGGIIELKTRQQARANISAKVDGSLLLAELIDINKLDFFVLCSSLAATLGSFGQLDYTAANLFQETFGEYVRAQGAHAVSISWDTWRETGMAIDTEVPEALLAQRRESLENGLSNQEGQRVFQYALSSREPLVMVSTQDLPARYLGQFSVTTVHTGANEEESPSISGSRDVTEMLSAGSAIRDRLGISTEYEAPENALERDLAAVWQRLFGISEIGIRDDFFELGGHSLLATQLLNKLRDLYPHTKFTLSQFFDEPTIAGTRDWIKRSLPAEDFKNRISELKTASHETRLIAIGLMINDFFSRYEDGGISSPEELPHNRAAWVTDFILYSRQELGLRLYPQELNALIDRSGFKAYLTEQFDQFYGLQKAAPDPDLMTSTFGSLKPQEISFSSANPPAVFIFSAPRSGSTLLRLMLAGFPELFCPPELGLLSFDQPREWLLREHTTFTYSGYAHGIAELTGWDLEKTKAQVEHWAAELNSTKDLYLKLQELHPDQLLVDKTPGYAMSQDFLRKAEAWFSSPKYVHLVRHPAAMTDSFARNRMHVLLGAPRSDPHALGLKIWQDWNRNIIEFLEKIPTGRHTLVSFEGLVQDPENTMRHLAAFLEIPFNEASLQPYSSGRMIAGPGDPDIFLHENIRPEKADAWRDIQLPIEFSPEALELAARFGYDLNTPARIDKIKNKVPDVDAMSDEEVEQYLKKLLGNKG